MLVLPFSDIAVEIVEDSPFATSDNLFNEEKIFIKREWSEIRLKTYILGRCAAHRALQTLQKEQAVPPGLPVHGRAAARHDDRPCHGQAVRE